MTLKSIFGWILLLGIVIGGGWFLMQQKAVPTAAPIIEKKTVAASDPNGAYDIDIEYPFITGLPLLTAAKVNTEIQKDIDALAIAFKQDAETTDGASTTEKSALLVRYNVLYQDPRLVSIRFDIAVYSAGAAHPNSFTTTLVYDLGTGIVVRLADIFKKGVDPLAFLSSYTAKALMARNGLAGSADMVAAGTAPKAENFKSYLVTREGLLVIFDPYQVAAYAAGPQEVVVPWSALAGSLASDGPVAHLVPLK